MHTKKYKEKYGLTFFGRGFNIEISTAFDEKIEKALEKTAEIVADECPTGALAKRK